MNKLLWLAGILLAPFIVSAHGFDETELSIEASGVKLYGTLTIPAHAHAAVPLVIIIPGSGPTDRDCNGPGFKSNAYRKMAAQFALNGIASFRYDKRGVGKSIDPDFKEENMYFGQSVSDAKAIIASLEKDVRFTKITIAGHSEGSLVGMMSAGEHHKFISIAGISTHAHELLKEQLKGKLGDMESVTFKKLDSLATGLDVTCDNPMLMSLLRPSVLPYLKSWFQLNPAEEIKRLKGPVLIINGTKDLQVPEKNAYDLSRANKNAALLIVPDMNHLMTGILTENEKDNIASYNQPELPLSKKMMDEIILFVVK